MCMGGSRSPAPPPPPIAAPVVLEQVAPDLNKKQKRQNGRKRDGNRQYRKGYRQGFNSANKSTLGGIPTSGSPKTPTGT